MQILDAAEYGIDVFDTAYATEMAAAGHALVFPLQPASLQPHSVPFSSERDDAGLADASDAAHTASSSTDEDGCTAADSAQQELSMDFSDVALRNVKSPLQEGCSCYTCSKYSRAYLHHLVQREELLSSVLLELHNTHHMQGWFAVLRSAISAGDFEQYAAWFGANYRVPAPVAKRPLADAVAAV